MKWMGVLLEGEGCGKMPKIYFRVIGRKQNKMKGLSIFVCLCHKLRCKIKDELALNPIVRIIEKGKVVWILVH